MPFQSKSDLEQAHRVATTRLAETRRQIAARARLAAHPVARLTATDRSQRVFAAAAQTPGGRFALIRVASKVARSLHKPGAGVTEICNGALAALGAGDGRGCFTWGERDETLDSMAAGVTFGPGFNRGTVGRI